MNLFGVGPLELIVVLVVALVFVGPERLPRLAADLARTIREIRKYTGALSSEFNEYVKEVEKDVGVERSEWKQIGDGIGSATQSVTDALRSARTAAEGTPAAKAVPTTTVGGTPTPASAPTSGAQAAASPDGEWKEIGAGLAGLADAIATNGRGAEAVPHSNGATETASAEERA